MEWKKLEHNEVLNGEGFYISYNRNTGSQGANKLTDLANIVNATLDGEIEGDFKDGEETALYDHKVWRILEGDFRKEYEQAFPDFDACLAVYQKNIKHRSNWSTD